MFKHILIPNDGSEVAAKAIRAGIQLAAEMGAKVTGFCAEEPRPLHLHTASYGVEKDLVLELDKRASEFAQRCVKDIESVAKAAGVAFEPLVVKSEQPYEAIVRAAKDRKCDAIFMASHGHRGIKGLLLGSVTQQVLTHSAVPVLVFR